MVLLFLLFRRAAGNLLSPRVLPVMLLPLALLTLPLWLLGRLGLVASLLLKAWLKRRLFVYDALARMRRESMA